MDETVRAVVSLGNLFAAYNVLFVRCMLFFSSYSVQWSLNTVLIMGKKFYILLTVLHVMILGKWPTWRTILYYVFIFILTLYMFRTHRAHHQERQTVSTQPLVTVALFTVGGRGGGGGGGVGGVHSPPPPRHGHRQRVTVTRGCIDTICLSWWWARCAWNM
jgi:Ca2+/Na+ antiporter